MSKKKLNKKLKRKTTQSSKRRLPLKKTRRKFFPKKNLRFIFNTWKILVAVSVLLSIVSSLFFFYPRLSLLKGNIIEPKNPFYTKFILENSGYFSIRNINFTCFLNEARYLNGELFMSNIGIVLVNETIKELKPNTKSKLSIDRIFSRNFQFSSADIIMNITYEYHFYPFRKTLTQRFITELDSNGNLVWEPVSIN